MRCHCCKHIWNLACQATCSLKTAHAFAAPSGVTEGQLSVRHTYSAPWCASMAIVRLAADGFVHGLAPLLAGGLLVFCTHYPCHSSQHLETSQGGVSQSYVALFGKSDCLQGQTPYCCRQSIHVLVNNSNMNVLAVHFKALHRQSACCTSSGNRKE